MGRLSNSRAKDEAVEMDAEHQGTSKLWAQVRGKVSPRVREIVDLVAANGGLTLHDIELMEVTAHAQLAERIRRLEKVPKSTTAIASCLQMQGQARKHLRTLRLVMAPIGTPNDQRHVEPEAEAKRRALQAELAASAERAGGDTGDELVN
jgi:hypothetical protein